MNDNNPTTIPKLGPNVIDTLCQGDGWYRWKAGEPFYRNRAELNARERDAMRALVTITAPKGS